MKKTISILITALVLCASVFAQDSRQRLTTTIVGDVLAQMPAANAAEASAHLKDIAASAPESVTILAGMLQSADKGANNKIEYAISGVTNYVAVEGSAYKEAVKAGLKAAAAACPDKYNKQFIEQQLRLLSPESEPVVAEPAIDPAQLAAKVKTNLKSGQRNLLCEALYIQAEKLGTFTEKTVLKALKSSDRAYRTMALSYADAFAGDGFYAKLAKAYKGLGTEAKADVINWLGDKKAASQLPLIIGAITPNAKNGEDLSESVLAAIEAAGKIGGGQAADALISQLDGKNAAAAMKALLSFAGDISGKVEAAIDGAGDAKLNNLLKLASARRMANCAGKVFGLASKGNASALNALAGVVTPGDIAKLSTLADKAAPETVEAYVKAFESAISTLSPAERYQKVKYAIEGANNKERFFNALAKTGTDEAVEDLKKAFANGSANAVYALGLTGNYKAAPSLLEAGKAGNPDALKKYVEFVGLYEKNIDSKCKKLVEALDATKSPDIQNFILNKLGSTPTAHAFATASSYQDNEATAIEAAFAVKNIASKCIDNIDYNDKINALNKAVNALAARGHADDGYAIDEIKKLVSEAEAPMPISQLSEEEKEAGFEMLFDGTNLDKWIGEKEGYRIVNNVIYVTAGYGNGGNLYTAGEYRDFVFRFEFSFARPGANNGVGVRTPMGVDAAYEGMCEVQVLDHDDPIYKDWLKDYQVHGSVYGVIPAKRIVHKPLGEWSCEEIRVQGNHITVTVNGEVIVDGDIKEACQGHNVAPDGSNNNPFTVDHRNHPGMFNTTGHIGFLGHGAGVRYRNVRVLDLAPAKAKKGRK